MQNVTNHQMMGYDRAITMFSPDGRLLQVEYAKKTVKQGSTALALVAKDGVVFVADKRIMSPLILPKSVEKIFQIESHIAATSAGIVSDARVLIERAQIRAQQYKITHDSPIDVLDIVKDVASIKQWTTQSGGMRPFGVSLIIGGVDLGGPALYVTDPTGIFFEYKAVAIGEGDKDAEEYLIKEYKDGLSVSDCIKLAIAALKSAIKEEFDVKRLDVAYIKTDAKEFERVDPSELTKYL